MAPLNLIIWCASIISLSLAASVSNRRQQPMEAASSSHHRTLTSRAALQVFLRDAGFDGDEKEWADRPLKGVSGYHINGQPLNNKKEPFDPIGECIAKINRIKDEQKANGKNVEIKKIAKEIMKDCFHPADSEITEHLMQLQIAPGSLLDMAIKRIEKSVAAPGVTDAQKQVGVKIVEVAKQALYEMSRLFRDFKPYGASPPNPQLLEQFSTQQYIEVLMDHVVLCFKRVGSDQVGPKCPLWREHVFPVVPPRNFESTLLALSRPHIIPGGRFREAYYWDSYWVIRGLLVSGNIEEAEGMVLNFADLIATYGFVPNGLRTYYLDRSQPPLFSRMVEDVNDAWVAAGHPERGYDLVLKCFSPAVNEYARFWMNPKNGHVIQGRIRKKNKKGARVVELNANPERRVGIHDDELVYLNRYHSFSTNPRLESFNRDSDLLDNIAARNDGGPQKEELMRHIRAAAESGWDFSTRWLRPKNSTGSTPTRPASELPYETEFLPEFKILADLDTTNIAPVDLNSILYRAEVSLSKFARLLSEGSTINPELKEALLLGSETLLGMSEKRKATMKKFMWDTKTRTWHDVNSRNFSEKTFPPTAAAAVALWSGIGPIEAPLPPKLLSGWGITPTETKSTEQWDAPNVWPPLLHCAVAVLDSTRAVWTMRATEVPDDVCESMQTQSGLKMASGYVRSVLAGHESSKTFFEKYNGLEIGRQGGGGEYGSQAGFGWTNGVFLDFVTWYNAELVTAS